MIDLLGMYFIDELYIYIYIYIFIYIYQLRRARLARFAQTTSGSISLNLQHYLFINKELIFRANGTGK